MLKKIIENEDTTITKVQCILCRAFLNFQDGDMTKFTSHMANGHGAFFNLQYLLASCLMHDEHRDSIIDSYLTSSPDTTKATLASDNHSMKREVSEVSNLGQPKSNTNAAKATLASDDKSMRSENFEVDDRKFSVVGNKFLEKSSEKKQAKATEDSTKLSMRLLSDTKSAEKDNQRMVEGESFWSDLNISDIANFDPNKVQAETKILHNSPMNSNYNQLSSEKKAKERAFKCTYCDKTFTTYGGCWTHKKKHENTVDLEKRDEKSALEKRNYYPDAVVKILQNSGIDITKSVYFNKTKQSIRFGGNTSTQYTEVCDFLPIGWRRKTFKTWCNGKEIKQFFYLAPNKILLKSNIGVLEYLRLEGKMTYDELVTLAVKMRVGTKILQKLFDFEPHSQNTLEEESTSFIDTELNESLQDEDIEIFD